MDGWMDGQNLTRQIDPVSRSCVARESCSAGCLLSIYPSIYLSICLSIYLSIYIIHPPIHQVPTCGRNLSPSGASPRAAIPPPQSPSEDALNSAYLSRKQGPPRFGQSGNEQASPAPEIAPDCPSSGQPRPISPMGRASWPFGLAPDIGAYATVTSASVNWSPTYT